MSSLAKFRVAGGDHRGPQVFGPGLEVPAPVGQARRQDYLQDVFPGDSGSGVQTGQELQPELEVRGGVAHHQGLFRGAGGGQDADDVPERHGEQAVRVVFRQVAPGGAGEPGQITQAPDVIQVQPLLVEPAAVELHLTVSPGEGALETLQLEQFQFPPVHGLNFRLAHAFLPNVSRQGAKAQSHKLRIKNRSYLPSVNSL